MVDTAAAELEGDVRRTIRAIYRHSNSTAPDAFLTISTSFLTPYDDIQARQEWNPNLVRSNLQLSISTAAPEPPNDPGGRGLLGSAIHKVRF